MERSFKTFFAKEQLDAYQRGVMGYEYRGVPCAKSPIDIAIYLRLIQECRCRSVIEIGSKFGGSALMFRDFARLICDPDVRVVSIDLKAPDAKFEGIRFVEGNVEKLSEAFDANQLWALPRPWLIVEDSEHSARACEAALEFFAHHMQADEWLVMEDGVLDELGLTEKYSGGPNKAIKRFFEAHPGIFSVGTRYCDMFGPNATYCPNGYLQRTDKRWHVE